MKFIKTNAAVKINKKQNILIKLNELKKDTKNLNLRFLQLSLLPRFAKQRATFFFLTKLLK